MFTGLRILCFSLIVFSVTVANAQFDRGHHRPPPGWGRPPHRPFPPGPPPPPPRPVPPPPAPGPFAVDVHRFFHPMGDHLMTTNWQEGYGAGYQHEGVAFSLWNDDGRGMRIPMFRCFAFGRSHFVSNDWNCQGHAREGLLGFADRQPSGWSPREVVHCSNGIDHLATTDRNECYRAGYQIYEVLGYVR